MDAYDPWTEEEKRTVPKFFDLLDGVWEDIERLEGYAAEYAYANSRNLDVKEYSESLCIDNVTFSESSRAIVLVDAKELLSIDGI